MFAKKTISFEIVYIILEPIFGLSQVSIGTEVMQSDHYQQFSNTA